MTVSMTAEQAQLQLGYLFPDLVASWKYSWDTHLAEVNHPHLTRSCRAQIMQNLAVGEVRTRLQGRGGHRFRFLDQRAVLIVDDLALIAFKKFDDQLLCTGQSTSLARGFFEQEELPNFPRLIHLVCGVLLEQDWTGILGTHLVCPRSLHANNWHLDLNEDSGGSQVADLPLEVGPDTMRFTPRRELLPNEAEHGA